MIVNGEAFVPGNCDRRDPGSDGDIANMIMTYELNEDLRLVVDTPGGNIVRGVEASVYFHPNQTIGPADIEVPVIEAFADFSIDSADATHAIDIAKRADAAELQETLRQKLCERVANCHGVVEGVCWALGTSAMIEVVRDVAKGIH